MEGMGRDLQIYEFAAFEIQFHPTELKTYNKITPDVVFGNHPSGAALQGSLGNLDAFVDRLIPLWHRIPPFNLSFNLVSEKMDNVLSVT